MKKDARLLQGTYLLRCIQVKSHERSKTAVERRERARQEGEENSACCVIILHADAERRGWLASWRGLRPLSEVERLFIEFRMLRKRALQYWIERLQGVLTQAGSARAGRTR